MAHDVFICHTTEDRTIANAACAKLERAGIRCWIAPRDAIAGIPYGRQLAQAISDSRVVLLIFSDHANRSDHVLRELEIASDGGTIIAPFRIEEVLPSGDLRYYIQRIHWLDAMTPPMEARLADLLTLVQRLLEIPQPSSSQAAEGVRPRGPISEQRSVGAPQRFALPLVGAAVAAALVLIAVALAVAFRPRSQPAVAVRTPGPARTAQPVARRTHAPQHHRTSPPRLATVILPTPRIVYVTAPPVPRRAPARPAPAVGPAVAHRRTVTVADYDQRDAQANALNNAGLMEISQGQFAAALQTLPQAVALFHRLGDRDGEGNAYGNTGNAQASLGQYGAALQSLQQSLLLHREVGDLDHAANNYNNIGLVQARQGQYPAALQSFERARTLWRRVGDTTKESRALANIANVKAILHAP